MARIDTLPHFLEDIANAIRSKTKRPGLIPASKFDSEIKDIISAGTCGDAVIFFDYDGTQIANYTANEFLALSSWPTPPVHEGLIFDKWNWPKADADDYVSKYGYLNIGALYKTENGVYRIKGKVGMTYNSQVCTKPNILLHIPNNSGTLTITWDTNVVETFTVGLEDYNEPTYFAHNYGVGSVQEKTVTIQYVGDDPNNEVIYVDDVWTYNPDDPDLGSGERYAYTANLLEFYAPECTAEHQRYSPTVFGSTLGASGTGLIYLTYTEQYNREVALNIQGGSNLRALIFPNNTSFTTNYASWGSASLRCFCCASNSWIARIDHLYPNSYIKHICLPSVISKYQQSLITPQLGGSSRDYIHYVDTIIIPEGYTSIPSHGFYNQFGVKTINLPSTITRIEAQAFGESGLNIINMPAGLTYIHCNAFNSCKYLSFIDFSSCLAIPELGGTSSSSSLGSVMCKIIVPDDLYDEWIETAGWSALAARIISFSQWQQIR